MTVKRRIKLLIREFEIIVIFSVFLVYGIGLAFTMMRLSHVSDRHPLEWVFSPMYIQFLLIPVHLFLLYRHDTYTYNLYCKIRVLNTRQLFFLRLQDLFIETIAFVIPLIMICFLFCAGKGIPFATISIFGLTLFFWFLLIGIFCVFVSELFGKRHYGYLILFLILIIDSLTVVGLMPYEKSIVYIQLETALYKTSSIIQQLQQAMFILTEIIFWSFTFYFIHRFLIKKEFC